MNRGEMKNPKDRQQSYKSRRMMPQPKKVARFLISSVVVALLVLAAYQQSRPQANSNYDGLDLVDKSGIIRKPSDYRDRYQALGVFSVADLNGNTEMHYTYATPGTAE